MKIITHMPEIVGHTLPLKIQFYDLQNRACRYINDVLRFNAHGAIVATALTEQYVGELWHRSLLVVPKWKNVLSGILKGQTTKGKGYGMRYSVVVSRGIFHK